MEVNGLSDPFFNFSQQILNLPSENIINIFSYLSAPDLTNCSLACKKWNQIAFKDSLWRQIAIRSGIEFFENPVFVKKQLEKKVIERKIKDNYPAKLIELFGGVDSIINIPVLHLNSIRKNSLIFSGAITSDDLSASIMRGVFDKADFITFCYSYEKNQRIFSGVNYLFWKEGLIFASTSIGAIESPFKYPIEECWDHLAQFIKEGQTTVGGLTFQLIHPQSVNKDAEKNFSIKTYKIEKCQAGICLHRDIPVRRGKPQVFKESM